MVTIEVNVLLHSISFVSVQRISREIHHVKSASQCSYLILYFGINLLKWIKNVLTFLACAICRLCGESWGMWEAAVRDVNPLNLPSRTTWTPNQGHTHKFLTGALPPCQQAPCPWVFRHRAHHHHPPIVDPPQCLIWRRGQPTWMTEVIGNRVLVWKFIVWTQVWAVLQFLLNLTNLLPNIGKQQKGSHLLYVQT